MIGHVVAMIVLAGFALAGLAAARMLARVESSQLRTAA
jgi:hypothetical protein